MKIILTDNDIERIIEAIVQNSDGDNTIDCYVDDICLSITYFKSVQSIKDDDYYNGTGVTNATDVHIYVKDITSDIGIDVEYDSSMLEELITETIMAS